MREIINRIQHFSESVSLTTRSPGDIFENPQGQQIIFRDLRFYPEKGGYDDPIDLDQAVETVANKVGVEADEIAWTNRRNQLSRGFGLAHFTDHEGNDYFFGRWMQDINPSTVKSYFSAESLPGGFRLETASSRKERAPYKPSDILNSFNNLTAAQVARQIVRRFGANSDEARAIKLFMAAESFPIEIPRGNMGFSAFRDYFCELLHPIALITNKPLQGNAQEAARIFFGEGQGFEDCSITFSENPIQSLVDSVLTKPSGQQISISSKTRNRGAASSVSSLVAKVRDMESVSAGRAVLKKHLAVVEDLRIIDHQGQIEGPLSLAVKYDIITEMEKEQIMSLRNLSAAEFDVRTLSGRLRRFYRSRQSASSSRVIPQAHLVSVIAEKVCMHINKKTDFGSAAADILNHSAMIQVQTKAIERGDFIVLQGFRAIYPSRTVTRVVISSKKNYFSTAIKGKLTFKLLSGNADESMTALKDIEQPRDLSRPPKQIKVDRSELPRSQIHAAPEVKPEDELDVFGRGRRRRV